MEHAIDTLPKQIELGNQGESGILDIDLDCTTWLTDFPAGEILATFLPPDSYTPELLPITQAYVLEDDVTFRVIVMRNMTRYAGKGSLNIRLVIGDDIEKRSAVVGTYTAPSHATSTEEMPADVEDWATEATQKLAEIMARMGFVPKGDYNAATEYKHGDWVSANGGSYGYIWPEPSTGVSLTDTSHWQQIASIGGQDILDAVTAEKNAAIAAKVLAEGYAAQLAAGTASPAGTYANLAALNDGTPAAPNTSKIYLTLNDGKWCYHNGSAWVEGGVYLATLIPPENYSSKLPSSMFEHGSIGSNGNLGISVSRIRSSPIRVSAGDTLHLPLTTSYVAKLYSSLDTRVDTFIEGSPSWTQNGLYTVPVDGFIRVVLHFTDDREITLPDFDVLTNGVLFVKNIKNNFDFIKDSVDLVSSFEIWATLVLGYPEYPDYDSATKTLTFPAQTSSANTINYNNGSAYSFGTQTTVVNTHSTTNVKLIFNITAQTMEFLSYSTPLTADQRILAVVRHDHRRSRIHSTFPCKVDGTFDFEYFDDTYEPGVVLIGINYTLPNFDTSADTLTFYEDTMVVTHDKTYRLEVDTVCQLTVSSSAKKLYFRPSDKSFFVLNWNSYTANDTDIFLGAIRYLHDWLVIFSGSFDYTVDGLPKYAATASAGYSNVNVNVVSHRGYGTAPENTLPAYKLSKTMGYKYVECDVHFTSDNIPVILHDATIDRTSDGTGNVADFTYAQLLGYDFGSWKSALYIGTKIPTFSEFIKLCKLLGLYAYIELKMGMTQDQVNTLVNIVRRQGMIKKCCWFGFSIDNLPKVLVADPDARIGLSVGLPTTGDIDGYVTSLSPETNDVFLLMRGDLLTQNIHDYAVDSGFKVEVWNSNSSVTALNCVEIGVSGVFVDTLALEELLIQTGMST